MYNLTREHLVSYWIDVLGGYPGDIENTETSVLSSRLTDSEIKDCAIYNNVEEI